MRFLNRRDCLTLGALVGTSLLALGLSACGGGGEDSAAVTAPTTSFPLATAYAAYISQPRTERFTASGTLQGVSFTASGTTTQTSPTNATIDGKAVQTNSRMISATATAQNQSIGVFVGAVQYFSNGSLVAVMSGGPYLDIKPTALPASATVGASGTLYTGTLYDTDLKHNVMGTSTVTYNLEPDSSPSSAILRLTYSGTGGEVRIRITTSGAASTVSEPVLVNGTMVTVNYQ